MNLEQFRNQDKAYLKAIGDFILKRIESDELFASKINETKKTLKGCIDYVKNEAKKQADNNVAFLTDDEVYGLVVHYYIEDDIIENKIKEETTAKINSSPKPKKVVNKKEVIEKIETERATLFDFL